MSLSSWLGLACYIGQIAIFLISSILCFKYRNAAYILLFTLLSIELFSESVGFFKGLRHLLFSKESSGLLSKIELIIEVFVYQLLFAVLLKNKLAKRIAIYSSTFTLALFIFLNYTIEPINCDFPLISFSFGAIMTVLGLLYYFYEKIKHYEIESFTSSFWNWIFAGLLVFISIEIPFMCIFNYATLHPEFVKHFEVMVNIKQVASLIFYSSFIFGFIWMKEN